MSSSGTISHFLESSSHLAECSRFFKGFFVDFLSGFLEIFDGFCGFLVMM
jgi:hypothetical protein